jgi:hypothetical protein
VQKKVKKMHAQDCVIVIVFMVLLWICLAYVIVNVSILTNNINFEIISIISGGLAGAFATVSLIVMLAHLTKNRDTLYAEDISNSNQ